MTESNSASDDEFLKGVAPFPRNRRLALAIRDVIAEWCGVRPELLLPQQSTCDLHEKMKAGWARGWDETGFWMKLEEHLGTQIDMHVRLPPFYEWEVSVLDGTWSARAWQLDRAGCRSS